MHNIQFVNKLFHKLFINFYLYCRTIACLCAYYAQNYILFRILFRNNKGKSYLNNIGNNKRHYTGKQNR